MHKEAFSETLVPAVHKEAFSETLVPAVHKEAFSETLVPAVHKEAFSETLVLAVHKEAVPIVVSAGVSIDAPEARSIKNVGAIPPPVSLEVPTTALIEIPITDKM